MLLPHKIARGTLLKPQSYHVPPLPQTLHAFHFIPRKSHRPYSSCTTHTHPTPLVLLSLGCASHTPTSGPLHLLPLCLEHSFSRYLSVPHQVFIHLTPFPVRPSLIILFKMETSPLTPTPLPNLLHISLRQLIICVLLPTGLSGKWGQGFFLSILFTAVSLDTQHLLNECVT